MSEVQVGLGTVLRNIDLTVLIGAHGPGIHVDIRIHLLCRNLQTPRLQKSSEGCRGDPLSKTRDDASGNKNIFRHTKPPVFLAICNMKKTLQGEYTPESVFANC